MSNVLTAQWLGEDLVAGGTGSAANEVKFFRNEPAADGAPGALTLALTRALVLALSLFRAHTLTRSCATPPARP